MAFLDAGGRAASGEADPAVASEVAARLNYWRSLGQRRPAGAGLGCVVVGILVVAAVRVVVGPVYAFLVANPLVLTGVLGAFLLIGIPIDLRARRRRRIFATLVNDYCATCGYDLEGHAVRSMEGNMVRLGPSACPECGAPWPLVPPPIPGGPRDQGSMASGRGESRSK